MRSERYAIEEPQGADDLVHAAAKRADLSHRETSCLKGWASKTLNPLRQEATAIALTAAPAASLCAGHAQQLGGESPPLNLMEVKS